MFGARAQHDDCQTTNASGQGWQCGLGKGRNGLRLNQTLQNPLIKEYTLNHIRDPIIIYCMFLFFKGFWSLWVTLNPKPSARKRTLSVAQVSEMCFRKAPRRKAYRHAPSIPEDTEATTGLPTLTLNPKPPNPQTPNVVLKP